MIVGESEVQGQVRRALRARARGGRHRRDDQPAVHDRADDRQAGALGDRIARGARASRPSPSTSPRTSGDLAHRHVVIIGAGETSELTAQALAAKGVKTVFVANRHAARARSVAARFGGAVVSLDALPAQLAAADIVVASTSSPHPIVGSEELEVVMLRGGRPLVLIDIAVPRDVDPACGELARRHALRHRRPAGRRGAHARGARRRGARAPRRSSRRRSSASPAASAAWRSLPTVAALRAHADAIVDQVLGRERRQVGERVAARPQPRRGDRARGVNRLLHEPTIRLRAMARGLEPRAAGRLLRELFGLESARRRVGDDDTEPTSARSAREDRHPRQRARAGAGAADRRRPGGASWW